MQDVLFSTEPGGALHNVPPARGRFYARFADAARFADVHAAVVEIEGGHSKIRFVFARNHYVLYDVVILLKLRPT